MSKRAVSDSASVSKSKKLAVPIDIEYFVNRDYWKDVGAVCQLLELNAAAFEAYTRRKYHGYGVICCYVTWHIVEQHWFVFADLDRLVASGAMINAVDMFDVATSVLDFRGTTCGSRARHLSWALARTQQTMTTPRHGGHNLLARLLRGHSRVPLDDLVPILSLHCHNTVEYENASCFLDDFKMGCAGFRVVVAKEDVTDTVMSFVRRHADRDTERECLDAAVCHAVRVGGNFDWLRECCGDFKPLGQFPWILECVNTFGPMVADKTWVAAAESFDPATNPPAADAHREALELIRGYVASRD